MSEKNIDKEFGEDTDRISWYKMEKIYEPFMGAPEQIRKFSEGLALELKVIRDKVILAAMSYCKARMDIVPISCNENDVEFKEQCEMKNFYSLFKQYWFDKEIYIFAEEWVKELVNSLNYRQIGDLACLIAYKQAISVRVLCEPL